MLRSFLSRRRSVVLRRGTAVRYHSSIRPTSGQRPLLAFDYRGQTAPASALPTAELAVATDLKTRCGVLAAITSFGFLAAIVFGVV
jgi:hypothetical protein